MCPTLLHYCQNNKVIRVPKMGQILDKCDRTDKSGHGQTWYAYAHGHDTRVGAGETQLLLDIQQEMS